MLDYSTMMKAFIVSSLFSLVMSLTLWTVILTAFFRHINGFIIVLAVIYVILNTYFQVFQQFEKRYLPVPRFYRTNIPMIGSYIAGWVAILWCLYIWVA